MNNIQKRRLYLIIFFAFALTLATSLILYALKQNINVFFTPSQLATSHVSPNYHLRLGGMVKKGSVKHDKEGLGLEFVVTDLKHELLVRYVGVLPDLFREGSGVIAEGSVNEHDIFIATQVLAKHDENYMPKNIYQAMREKTG